jgi:two-component system cell cycle response regulator DivK
MSEYLVDSSRRAREPVIVLAEDDEDIRRVYGIILRHYGCRVEEALDGREAIEIVRATKPDLVLMDVSLPAMDGVAASRALKADAATRDIPILAFSADISTTADMPTANNTFDGYILKPISPTELARRITAYVDRRAGTSPSTSPSASSHGVGEAREVEVSHLERGHYDITT